MGRGGLEAERGRERGREKEHWVGVREGRGGACVVAGEGWAYTLPVCPTN